MDSIISISNMSYARIKSMHLIKVKIYVAINRGKTIHANYYFIMEHKVRITNIYKIDNLMKYLKA